MNQTQQLDPQVVALCKAIMVTESKGNFEARGKSGEYGAYQWTMPTWLKMSKLAGVNAPFGKATPEQQNQVAYAQIKQWKDQGLNPAQVASAWNAGPGGVNDYLTGNKGINSYGAHYDTKAYTNNVYSAYLAFNNQNKETQPQIK